MKIPGFANYSFVALMLLLASLTFFKYKEISDFRSKSEEFTFVVAGDDSSVAAAAGRLQHLTYQNVEKEPMDGGRYRLRIKCPPDKIGGIKSLLVGIILEDE